MAAPQLIIPENYVWKYLIVPWGDPVDHSMDDISGWASGAGPFSNGVGNPRPYNTSWPSTTSDGKDLWLATDIDAKWRDLVIEVEMEDHGLVYINGNLVFSQTESGTTSAGYNEWDLPNTYLNSSGTSRLVIRCNDERPPASNTSVWAYISVWATLGSGWTVGAVAAG